MSNIYINTSLQIKHLTPSQSAPFENTLWRGFYCTKQSISRLKEITYAKRSTKILISKINILTFYYVYLIDYSVIFHE